MSKEVISEKDSQDSQDGFIRQQLLEDLSWGTTDNDFENQEG